MGAEVVDALAPTSRKPRQVPAPVDRGGKWGRVNAQARQRKGGMNGVESKRAAELRQFVDGGVCAWWAYESMSFRLAAKGARYTPDFVWVRTSGEIVVEEIKGTGGWLNEASKLRWKIAAELNGWATFRALIELPKKKGGGWRVEDYVPRGELALTALQEALSDLAV